jgi:site-specific DNA-adenine methylase
MEAEKKKRFISAPLPFQGQKRKHVKNFTQLITELKPDMVVDLFGGSGLLSHLAKRANPASKVIYNDFDNYCQRLVHVGKTNALLGEFRKMMQDVPEDSRLDASRTQAVSDRLSQAHKEGYVDWITLSVNLMFAMNYRTSYEDFTHSPWLYNKIRQDDYVTEGYLDGLEITHCDYRELLSKYRNTPNAIFLFDPPYLSSNSKTYNAVDCWKLNQYLDVLTELAGLRFVYFTSNKSQIIELCNWIDASRGKVRDVFKGASVNEVKSPTSGINSYTDIMIVKC